MSKETTLIEYHKRDFLNPNEGMAAYESNFKVNHYKSHNKKNVDDARLLDVEAEITISDCNRQITLEFGVWNNYHENTFEVWEKDILKRIDKAKTLKNLFETLERNLNQALQMQRNLNDKVIADGEK